MTEPKQRLPGTTYFVTGVCERHEFRLKPSKETNDAFAIAMMEAADRYGVDIIAVCQMSSHYHAVVHDRMGLLSEYLRDFHGVMGRYGSTRDEVINCKFWSSQDSEAVVLGDLETIVEKVAYTLANPTKDFIVERPEDWIGVHKGRRPRHWTGLDPHATQALLRRRGARLRGRHGELRAALRDP